MPARPPYTSRTLRVVRARALANMLGTVRVLRLVKPSYDEVTLIHTQGAATTIYTGRARIYQEQTGAAVIAGDSVLQTRSTIISLPYDAFVPRIDDIVIVDSFGADEELEDDVYSITDVGGGGLMRATRQLSVKAYSANRWWEA